MIVVHPEPTLVSVTGPDAQLGRVIVAGGSVGFALQAIWHSDQSAYTVLVTVFVTFPASTGLNSWRLSTATVAQLATVPRGSRLVIVSQDQPGQAEKSTGSRSIME